MPEKSGGRVGFELEAAEALAALAHHHIISAGKGDDAEDDDSQRFTKQFKNTHEPSTTPHDRLEVLEKNTTKNVSSMVKQSERAKKEFHRMRYGVHGSGSCFKSRNHLTEAEREEKRIRRVLANRESARQTIRRRQAMYELLIKDAAVLAMENENLKTEKERALIKYSSLKSTNEHLNDLLEKAVLSEAIRVQCGGLDLSSVKPSTSSIGPTFSVPVFLPPFVNSSEASPLVASSVSHADSEQGLRKSNGMGAPVYVFPVPWFFPLQMQCIVQSVQPSIQLLQHGDIQGSSMQAEGGVANCLASSCLDGGFGAALDVTCKQSAETMDFDAKSYGTGAATSTLPSHNPEDVNLVEMADASSAKCGLATKNKTPITCSKKKSASAAVAAEARRRRKELAKLKTLYCHNHRVR